MKIAVDTLDFDANNKDAEYVYVYDCMPYEELKNTNMHCIDYRYLDFVDINSTNYDIDCIKRTKVGEKDWDVLPPKYDFKIGIIIPNFNYEHTIEKCLESICSQTYKNFEIVFVDDMSTDNSVKIARKIATKYSPSIVIKIVELKQKRLNGGARNEAYLHLSNDVDYVYYVDSDDWLYDDKVLEDINERLQTRPDVLFVGLASYKKGRTKTEYTPKYKNKYDAMQGWSGSCGKVIRKSLATRQDCLYNEGTLKEDKNQHYRICIKMNSFNILKRPVYVWNQENTKSVTTKRDKVVWGTSTIRHYADTLQLYLSEKGKDKKVDELLKKRVDMTRDEMNNGGDMQW